jgi:hypothetical protein
VEVWYDGAPVAALTRGENLVVVVCSTPEAIRGDFPSLSADLLDGVTRRLKRENVKVVSPDAVATWLDDNGGRWSDPSEIAEQFDADFIIHIELEQFAYHQENSPLLLRGRATGKATAWAVHTAEGTKLATNVFEREYTSEYPQHHPVSVEQISDHVFRKRYLDRVCGELARMFYDYRYSDVIE